MSNTNTNPEEDDEPFLPDWVSPPGDTIANLLEFQLKSDADLARALGLSAAEVAGLLSGALPITPRIAAGLAAYLGSTEGFWLRREAGYVRKLARLGKVRPGI